MKTKQDKRSSDAVQAGQDAGAPVRKRGCQSNYDEYIVPPGMEEWAGDPLYLLVARWCMQQQRWVTRRDIETAFHLQSRRAAFQMTYISRKKARIVCRTRYCNNECGGRQYTEIRVKDILPPDGDGKPPVMRGARKKSGRRQGEMPQHRQVGNGISGHGCLWENLLKRARRDGDE